MHVYIQDGQHTSYIRVFFVENFIMPERNDYTNDNSFLNNIDENTTIQVRTVHWSGFYHTGSLLK
jgi:hypothetical protein